MKLKLCPNCGSGKLVEADANVLADNKNWRCSACKWEGPESALLVTVYAGHTGIDATLQVAEEVAISYLRELARLAGEGIGAAIVTAGLVGVSDVKTLSRLIRAACVGAHKATLEEIERIQEELRNERSGESFHRPA